MTERRRGVRAGACLAAALVVTGCTASEPAPTPDITSAAPTPTSTPTPTPTTVTGLWAPTGDIQTDVPGHDVSASLVRLPVGGALIGNRDDARVLELTDAGELRVAGEVGGVRPQGEVGLLGLAVRDVGDGLSLYAYFPAADDNRVV